MLDHETIKEGLIEAIDTLIKAQGLSHTAAAARMGIPRSDLSKLLHGQRAASLERLLKMVCALGNHVEVRVRPAGASREGRLKLKVGSRRPSASAPQATSTVSAGSGVRARGATGRR